MPENKIIPDNNLVDTASHFAGYLDSIIDSAKIGFWDLDISSGKTVYSKQYERILGYDEGEAPQLWSFWANAVWPEDLEVVQAKISDYLQGRIDSFEAQFRIIRKDGSLIWAQNYAVITNRDEKGNPLHIQGTFQDISAIKATEERLAEKRRQFDFVAKISGLVLWTFDIAGNTISYEDALQDLLGWTPEEASGGADH
jgi:PAS domain S-box-containing protein